MLLVEPVVPPPGEDVDVEVPHVLAAGGLPVLLPPVGKDTEIDALLDRVDGVLLTGGLDLDPRRNGQAMSNSIQLMADRRDASDRILVRRLIDREIPVMAIGVGMQQLNVAMGGSLFLHLPLDLPKALLGVVVQVSRKL